MNLLFPSRSTKRGSIALATVLLFTACGGGSEPAAEAQSIGGSGKAQEVGLKSLKFTPSKVTVKPGQRIDFKWNEGVAHNVVFDKTRKSKTVSKKGTVWSTTFDKEGTYKYKCTLHPGMNGQVTVKK